jgi:hypothetical protein
MQCAALPEAALSAEGYLSSLTTMAKVELSSNLQATLACSIYCCYLNRWIA